MFLCCFIDCFLEQEKKSQKTWVLSIEDWHLVHYQNMNERTWLTLTIIIMMK